MISLDKSFENIFTVILYVSIIFTFGFSISYNANNKIILGVISSALLVTVSIRQVIIYASDKFKSIGKFLILIDLALIYWIVLNDKSGVSQLYLLALVIEAVIYNEPAYSSIISLISFITFAVSTYIRNGYTSVYEFIPLIIGSFASFLFVYGLIFITKYQITQRQKLSKALKEIEVKKLQLENAYEKLKQNSEVLEEVTVLKERNRIAREIHDTVGHTLTTVLIEVEAGKRLISKNPVVAADKLELAQEQLRKGLSDIRKSVKMLQDRGTILEFVPSLESLILETEKHTEVRFKYDISIDIKLPEAYEKLIYNTLLESITNGIKHGNSSEFIFYLTIKGDMLYFQFKDNGIGCDNIIPGFGLTTMRSRVEELGGTFQILSSGKEGCSIILSLPLINSFLDI